MKKIVNIILSTLLLCVLCPFTFFNVEAQTNEHYSLYGNGTEHSPYVIRNDNEWNTFTSEVNSDPTHGDGLYFKLTNDIGSSGNEVSNYISGDFNGTFDGSNKTIWYNNLEALFKTNNGEIKNIVVRSSEEMFVVDEGVICQENNGVIDHCANHVSIFSYYLGSGICGMNNGLIINCINYAPIKPESTFGKTAGICGFNNSQIVNCINVGEVSWAGICIQCLDTSSIDVCLSYSYPLPNYGIAEIINDPYANVKVLYGCFYYTPDVETPLEPTNNAYNNNSATLGGNFIGISEGLFFKNVSIDNYDNQTNRKLTKWKLDGNGLPTYDELPSTGFMLSNGSLWIVVVGVIVIIAGIFVAIKQKDLQKKIRKENI